MSQARWATVKAAFTAASEAPPAERESVVRRLCQSDDAAYREVMRLLNHAAAPETMDVDPLGERPDALMRIGDYEIDTLIGSGASSLVYRARHPKSHVDVAIKLLRLAVASERGCRRLELEGDVLSMLRHPGIARVFETGSTQTEFGRLPFIVMELIEGMPIDLYADERDLDDRARIGLVARVCEAMAHAHRRGVIHRDIKPANILVDASGQPKIVDFGIAKSIVGELHATTLTTHTGDVLGTPGYMSPEQCFGQSAQADVRADVYALGVVLYELLTGERLFDVGDLPILAALEVIKRSDPPLIGTVRKELRGPIEDVLARAMNRDPRRRYESAALLADDLRRVLRDEPVHAVSAASFVRIRRTARRYRSVLAALVLLSTVLTIAVIVMASAATTARANAMILHDSFSIMAADDIDDAKDHLTRIRKMTPRAKLTADEASVLYDRLAGRFMTLHDPATAADLYREAHAASLRHVGRSDQQSLRALQVYTEALSMAGRPAEAERLVRDELAYWDFTPPTAPTRSAERETQRLLRLSMTLGEAMARQGRHDQALQYLEGVLAAQRATLPANLDGSEHTDVANTLDIIATIQQRADAP